MKLSAQLYTVRDFLRTQEDTEATLKKVKEMGYNSVQVSALGEYDRYWLSDVTKRLGLEICASHTPLERILEDTENVIREHQVWGTKYVGLGYYPMTDKEAVDTLLRRLDVPIQKIYDSGLKFVYHNHHMELEKVDGTRNYLQYMAERYPADKLGFILDFYWSTYAGEDAQSIIKEFGDRLGVVHFKDMKVDEKGEKTITEMGEGIIDYQSIYRALKEAGTEFVAIEQDDHWAIDPFESLKTGYINAKKLGTFE